MTVKTWLDIHLRDGQGQKYTLSYRVKDIAFAAAQTLPAAAKIEAVISAWFSNSATPSDANCTGYAIRVEEDTPSVTGGDGSSSISTTIRTRNDVTGIPGNYLVTVPGLNKAIVSFDSTNPNSIIVVGAMWTAIRTALADAAIAVGDPEPEVYSATASTDLIQTATAFDGRRSPPRAR